MIRLLLALMLVWTSESLAVIETYEFSSPDLELRYKALSQELRCPKCQNQNIADSNAPISRDLRAIVHEQLEAGATNEEIINFLVDRYGEFVRYRPGIDSNTLWLWSAPLILFVMAIAVVFLKIRKDGDGKTVSSNAGRASKLREKFEGDQL